MLATVNLLFSILLSLFSCGEGCKINFEKKDKHTSNLKLNKRNVFEFAIFFYLLLLFLFFLPFIIIIFKTFFQIHGSRLLSSGPKTKWSCWCPDVWGTYMKKDPPHPPACAISCLLGQVAVLLSTWVKHGLSKTFHFFFDLSFKRNIWINDGWNVSKWNSVWKLYWQRWFFILSSYLISWFFLKIVFLSLFMLSIQWLVLDTKRDEMNKIQNNFVWFCHIQLLFV